jgi:hypothetical protein
MAHRVLDIARQHRGARDVAALFYLHYSLTTDTQKFQRVEYIVKHILRGELARDIATRTSQEQEPNAEYTVDEMRSYGGYFIAFRPQEPTCAEIDVFYEANGTFEQRGSFRLCETPGETGKLLYKPPPPPDYDDQPNWLVWEEMYVDDDDISTPPKSRSASGSEGEMSGGRRRRRRRRTRRRKQGSRGKKI